jgi:EAL domain-containing protein (putative c-di-GMP-specific phosphodiesterase class I)
VLGFEGESPRPPCAWSRSVHLSQTGTVEAPLLAAALSARERLPENMFLAVNLSAHALLSPEVREAMAAAGSLDRVVLILSDDVEGEDVDSLRSALEGVRERGVTVAVDETASGYSSLRQVLRLRPDFIRLGAEFISDIDRDPAKAAIVETLGHLASRVDAFVIASGVANTTELDVLSRLGVPLGQGPLFGEALDEMVALADPVAEAVREAVPPPSAEPTVAALVEARPAVAWAAPIEDLADTFLDDPRHDVLVLVDERQRPLALAERASLLRGEPYERPVMRITPGSPLRAVARRAAARPVMERYHPLVVCDRRGVYLGIVRVEQLLDALAQ